MEISEAGRAPMMAETGVIAEKAQKAQDEARTHMRKEVQELGERYGVPFQDWEAFGEEDSKVPDDPEMGKLHGNGCCFSSTWTTWTFTSILPKIDARNREEDSSVRRIHA
jgi:hypothetical protein